MTVRRRRKKNKLRGHRTHGKGDTKNKRGSGSRGGVGKAGSHKHKFGLYYSQFGTERKKVRGKEKLQAMNLDEISESLADWEKEKKIERKGKAVMLDGKKLGIGKIIGRGNIDVALNVSNVKTSARAKQKIERAGGKTEGTEEMEDDEKFEPEEEEEGVKEE